MKLGAAGNFCLDNGTEQPGSPEGDRDGILPGLAALAYANGGHVRGVSMRRQWDLMETAPGVYDFGSITRFFAKLDEEDPSGWLKVNILLSLIEDEVSTGEPAYIAAAGGATWTSPNGVRCVPWDPFLQARFAALHRALAAHRVFDVATGTLVPLAEHSRVVRVNTAPPGFGPLRPASGDIEAEPGYTRELFFDAALQAFTAAALAWPRKFVSSTLNNIDDGGSPSLADTFRTALRDLFGLRFILFHDAFSSSRPSEGGSPLTVRPLVTFTPQLKDAADEGVQFIAMQAAKPYSVGDSTVQFSNAAEGVAGVRGLYPTCIAFEIYEGDITASSNFAALRTQALLMDAAEPELPQNATTFRKARPMKRPRRPNKPALDGAFPTGFAPSPSPTWTIAGLTNIEGVTNHTVYFPSVDRTVGIWVMLPAGYTAGSFDCATIGFQHGAASNDSGAGSFSDTLPAAFDDAIEQGILTTPTLMWGYHGTRYAMGTNTPSGAPVESIALLAYRWVHENFRCLDITDPSKHVRMGFSQGGRESLYHFFKQAKLFHEGKSEFCWGGVLAFGPPAYDENYGYAADSGIVSWTEPCISPSGAFTATELAIWGTKCAQTWIDLDALDGKLIRVVYGQGDPVFGTAGSNWNTRMNAEGVTHEFFSGIPRDDGTTDIDHNVDNYLNARVNVSRPAFTRVQAVFSGAL